MKITLTLFLSMALIQTFTQQSNLAASLDSIVQVEVNSKNFSGSVIVVENEKIIFSKSVGFANHNAQIKNELDTKSNIASIGKLFTKVIILQLVQEGKVKLTDPIRNFYPCFDSPLTSKITIAHLLEHKSGLGDVYSTKEYIKIVKTDNRDFQNEVVKIISKEKLKFTPGTETKYSNSGYYLLGAIASKVDGKSFEETMFERIFNPLKMANTGFAKTGDTILGHALPYEMKKNKPKKIPVALMGDRPSGAGSQYSTVSDLTKIYLSILNDTVLLNNNSKGLLFNHSEPADWSEIKNSGKLVGFVGGDTQGWSAKIAFYLLKGKNYGVIICANFDNMAHELDLKLRKHIMESGKEK